jgi:hypothetical protein
LFETPSTAIATWQSSQVSSRMRTSEPTNVAFCRGLPPNGWPEVGNLAKCFWASSTSWSWSIAPAPAKTILSACRFWARYWRRSSRLMVSMFWLEPRMS